MATYSGGEAAEDWSPSLAKDTYRCPHCGAIAQQVWSGVGMSQAPILVDGRTGQSVEGSTLLGTRWAEVGGWVARLNAYASHCISCGAESLWVGRRMVFPDVTGGPTPLPGMPEEVRVLYEEARGIASRSPRAAAAILRRAIEVLCRQVAADANPRVKWDGLHNTIVEMGGRGLLHEETIEGLHAVRVVGNDALHTEMIDFDESGELLPQLFGVTNLIVREAIQVPRERKTMLSLLPEAAQDKVAKAMEESRPRGDGEQ